MEVYWEHIRELDSIGWNNWANCWLDNARCGSESEWNGTNVYYEYFNIF